ncbi:MAG: ribosome small subunit-dependent GTPase A [Alkalispirochaeta sp.]
MIGVVVWGANNIYSVRDDTGVIHEHLRLKGKTLADTEGEHNPLAPGDRVVVDETGDAPRIVQREERRNTVVRWNRTRRRMQAIAANTDLLAIVTSQGTPEYRPAFVDRVLVMAELEELAVVLVLNKADLPLSEPAREHVTILQEIGYEVSATSATDREDPGIEALQRRVAGLSTVFFGQSGVGKSSLINRLVPGLNLATGDVSHRYHRGRHTTTLARQVLVSGDRGSTVYIDTPGVREYDLFGYSVPQVGRGFREFLPYIGECRMPDCTHTHEPKCAVLAAVAEGTITPRRYDSYRRIIQDMEGPHR